MRGKIMSKIMIGRIVLTVMELVFCFLIVNVFLEQEVAPKYFENKGIEQIENPGAGVVIRKGQDVLNWVGPFCYLISLCIVIYIWRKPLDKVFGCRCQHH